MELYGYQNHMFVENSEQLQACIKRIEHSEVLALDTEFVREKSYYPKLSLIQIASGDFCFAVDCLTNTDLGPLKEIIFDKKRLKILHSAKQDIEVLHVYFNQLISNIFDLSLIHI